MIIVKVGKKENIERALKRFKKKFRKTQIINHLAHLIVEFHGPEKNLDEEISYF